MPKPGRRDERRLTIAKYLLTHEREMISGIGDRVALAHGVHAADTVGRDAAGARPITRCLRTDIARGSRSTNWFLSAPLLTRTADRMPVPASAKARFSSRPEGYGASSTSGAELLRARRCRRAEMGSGAHSNDGDLRTHLAAHQGQFHRRRYQRGCSSTSFQAHPRSRLTPLETKDLPWLSSGPKNRACAGSDGARFTESALVAHLRSLRDGSDAQHMLPEVRRCFAELGFAATLDAPRRMAVSARACRSRRAGRGTRPHPDATAFSLTAVYGCAAPVAVGAATFKRI